VRSSTTRSTSRRRSSESATIQVTSRKKTIHTALARQLIRLLTGNAPGAGEAVTIQMRPPIEILRVVIKGEVGEGVCPESG